MALVACAQCHCHPALWTTARLYSAGGLYVGMRCQEKECPGQCGGAAFETRQEQHIDMADKFGVVAAANFGLIGNGFTTEAEAMAWLREIS